MSQPDHAEARAGAAGAAGGAHGETPTPAGAAGYATSLDESVPAEYGVRFTSDYTPGGDYEPAGPPPAGEQHRMGLHPVAARADRAALDAAGSQQALQGDEGPHVDASREG